MSTLMVAYRPEGCTAFEVVSPFSIDAQNRLILTDQQSVDGECMVVTSNMVNVDSAELEL
jgi:hypothetical protein